VHALLVGGRGGAPGVDEGVGALPEDDAGTARGEENGRRGKGADRQQNSQLSCFVTSPAAS